MAKILTALLLAAGVAAPAMASDPAPPYYGPAQHWHGIGYTFGYRDHVEKDGRWRIEASTRSGVRFDEAVDMAMYRAAEKARDGGYRFVAFLGGHVLHGPGLARATLYARPVTAADTPLDCPPSRHPTCYVASVAAVMSRLGGAGGTQPGVAIVDHLDRFGRAVTYSGYGTAAIGSMATPAAAVPLPVLAPPMPIVPALRPIVATPTAAEEAQARFDEARRAQQMVRHRDGPQGFTVSD